MIKIKNLTQSYSLESEIVKLFRIVSKSKTPDSKRKEVLTNLDLEVNRGEIIGLIGPNGAGKTTLVKVITGLLINTNGEVYVCDERPSDLSVNFKKRIALFRGDISGLDDGVTVKDSLEEKLKIYNQPDIKDNKYVKFLISQLKVERFLDRTPDSLSLGQRMLVELLYAISHDAELIILDEPTNGLDVVALGRFKEMLKQLKETYNKTLIITSHNLQNILAVSDRIILINNGVVVLNGSPVEIFKMANKSKLIKVEVTHLPKSFILSEEFKFKNSIIELRIDNVNINKVLKEILDQVEIVDIEIIDPPIEEIFGKYFER